MGSYYSILNNEAGSNGQYHCYFYVTKHQVQNWFKILHGPLPAIETEVISIRCI